MTLREHEFTDLSTLTGPMRTHVIRPAGPGKFPGIVLWSEIFQVTGPIRRAAAFLAGHGFIVAVPEVYHDLEEPGTVLAYDTAGAERGNAHKITRTIEAYDSDAAAAVEFLKNHPDSTGKTGSIGICLGGHLATRTALRPDISAGVCCYPTDIHQGSLGLGMADDTLSRLGEIKAEMLYLWGRQDPHIPRNGRRLIYDALTDGEVHFTWHEFNAQHAFLRDEGPRHDPELAQLSWSLITAMLQRTLKSAP
ncbi:MAG: dienelactone hydrolase [Verrucomicrobiales bacterium]|nr:dienelactone hydrolase [Verrucomicrobiales bacterium]